MNLAFLTYGLRPQNIRLMPWRYVLELAKHATDLGHRSVVITDGVSAPSSYPAGYPDIVHTGGGLSPSNQDLRAILQRTAPDVVVFPMARRNSLFRKPRHFSGAAHIAYFPGAWHESKYTLPVLRQLPGRDAIVYGLESIVPGRWLVSALENARVEAICTVTDFTAEKLITSGWDRSRLLVIPPGKDIAGKENALSKAFQKQAQALKGKRFFLYMGPPKAIRGIHTLLRAFDEAYPGMDCAPLVCLMRGGTREELHQLERTLARLRHRSGVHLVTDALTSADICAFLAACHSVVLPFLLVPSEVPLAVLEALAQGKPVLVSETGGTSAFVGEAGLSFPPGDTAALTTGLLRTMNDADLYARMCTAARSKAGAMPTWGQVSQYFYEFSERLISARAAASRKAGPC